MHAHALIVSLDRVDPTGQAKVFMMAQLGG